MKSIKSIFPVALVAAALMFSVRAHAVPPTDNPAILTTNGAISPYAYSYAWTNISGNTNAAGTIGWAFTVGSGNDLLVDMLGFFDGGDVALGDAHPVALWDSSSNLVTEVTIPAGVGTNYLAGYTYTSVTNSVTLTAGSTYYLGAYFPANNGDKFLLQINNPVGQQFDTNISWLNPMQTMFNSNQTSIAFPDNHLASNGLYKESFFGPTFRFTTAAVPEPSSYAFFGLSALALVFAARRARQS